MSKLVKMKKKAESMFTKEDVYFMAQEYNELSAKIKELDSRKKFLSEKIKEGSEMFGVKDDKGSFYLENENYLMGKVARKSYKIDEEKALPTLKAMGLGDVIDTITTEVVNEDKLNNAVKEGRISLNEVEKFTNVSTTYSVTVSKKEEMPEVEQSTLKVARKK